MNRRAVLYVRLSVAQDDVQSDSIARQEADLRELAEREGWEIVATLADDGLSGRKARANASEALRMVREREADVLAVWKLDRWTRQGLGAIGDLVTALEANPFATFVALRDGLRSDQPAWRLIAAVLSETARTEADNTATRVSAAAWANRGAGRFVGGTVPFGYRSAPRAEGGRTLVPHGSEAEVVRELAERVLSGESQAGIVWDLHRRRIPTTRSKYRFAEMRGEDPTGLDRGRWSYAALNAIMTGDSLLGHVSRSRTETRPDGRTRKVWETIRDADGQPLQAFPPLLDLDTVLRLRDAMRDPRRPARRRGRLERRTQLLSGLLYCALCGGKLWATTSGGRRVYSCGHKPGTCPGINTTAARAEETVSEAYLAVVGAWPEVELVEEITAPATVAELAEIERGLREASASLLEDGSDAATVVSRVETLKARRGVLQALPAARTTRAVETGLSMREAWESADLRRRQDLLAAAIEHIELLPTTSKGRSVFQPERLRIVWRS